MRKFILVAAMVLASASAQAGASRGLVVAGVDEPVTAEQPKTAETKTTEVKTTETPKATEAPKFVERPPAVETTTDQAKPVPDKRADRPTRHRSSVRARIVYELHRHGIYW
jgi:hypothetical protein